MVRILTDFNDTLDLTVGPERGPDTVLGLNGSDILTSDTLNGGSIIFGNRDNDSLTGAGVGDTVYAGQDNDQIRSLGGSSLFFGDLGDDYFESVGTQGNDTVFGGDIDGTDEGNDIFNFGNGGGSNLGLGNKGDDFLSGSGFGEDSLYGGQGDDTVQVVELSSFGGTGIGFGGQDDFVPETTLLPNNRQLLPDLRPGGGGGAIGDDSVRVVDLQPDANPPLNPGRNYLVGDLGDDVVIGLGDRDSLWGGEGQDSLLMLGNIAGRVDADDASGNLNGVPQANWMDGGVGNDSLVAFGGLRGRQTLWGGEGDDTIKNYGVQGLVFGNEGNDSIDVTNLGLTLGRNTVYGGQGEDTIVSGGTNLVYGDKGSDTLISIGNNDTLYGDNDTAGTAAGNDFITAAGATSRLFGNEGNDSLITAGADATLDGGAGADSLSAAGENSWLTGQDGNDTLVASGSNSTLIGGDGNDSLFATEGTTGMSLLGGEGDDRLISNSNTDTLIGGAGNDLIVGSKDADTLRADGPGNDTLEGFLGADSLIGTRGSFDAFVFQSTSTDELNDTITSFDTGIDKIHLDASDFFGGAGQATAGQPLRINLDFFPEQTQSGYSGTFTSSFTGADTPAIVFDAQDSGGILYYDPSGAAPAAGGAATSDLVTIAVIREGAVNANDIVLF
jgi:Ca2+-binding RTX toxin-like protein